jgi:transcriptional regulator with XRE-family HTH domain
MSYSNDALEEEMVNERLVNAMKTIHVSVNAVAESARVDRRTVERWMQGSKPNQNHRWAIADFLNMREDMLWPADEFAVESKPVASREIIAAYSHRSNIPPDVWWNLFLKARRNIDLLAYAMVFLPEQHLGLVDLLKKKARASCKIRIALVDPICKYVQNRDEEEGLNGTLSARIHTTLHHFRDILNYPGIEIRYHSTPLYNSVFRFDNEMFVTPHLYGLHGSRASLLHMCRLEQDGIFANFVSHFEAIWLTTTSIELGVVQ